MNAPSLRVLTPPLRALLCSSIFSLPIFSFVMAVPVRAQALPPLPIQFSIEAASQGRVGSRSGDCSDRNEPASGQISSQISNQISNQIDQQISAIAYTAPDSQTAFAARTSQAQPTLWFYIPTPISEATTATFTLTSSLNASSLNASSLNAPLYEGQLTGQTDRPGIIGVTLPTSLAVGDMYQWSLAFNCAESEQHNGEQSSNGQYSISGWIERRTIDTSLRQMFDAVGDRNRAALYANYGLLQDTLSALATLRRADVNDELLEQDWSDFLSELNLSELAIAPLLSCCQLGIKETAETTAQEELLPDTADTEAVETETTEAESAESEPPTVPEELPEQDSRTILQRARDRG